MAKFLVMRGLYCAFENLGFRIRATDIRETNWKWEHVVTTATPPHALDALYELPLSAL